MIGMNLNDRQRDYCKRSNRRGSNLLRTGWLLGLCVAGLLMTPTNNDLPAQDFDTVIAPLISENCLDCHSGKEPEGELDLSTAEAAFRGGESGASILPGKVDESLLWEKIDSDEMPPKHPMTAAEKKLIRNWIEAGAKWGTSPIDRFAKTTGKRAGRDFWSIQPLKKIEVPVFDDPGRTKLEWDPGKWSRNEIDPFIARRLLAKKLRPSGIASPRALIRRLYYDLIGLPPSVETIQAFERDPSDENYLRIVDELLASKHYGERWGRHWLDVVRFGESDGFERNNPRRNAWHYRDWVIQALNQDTPYDKFVEAQLVGDRSVGGIEGAAATGFWVAGVHNTVVGGSKRMKQLARQDEIEEVLATVGQTFVGLTVNCGRCHDHKYDPITQKEYYRMASAISGLGYGEKTVKSRVDQQAIELLQKELGDLREKLAKLEKKARDEIIAERKKGKLKTPAPPQPTALWDFEKDFDDSVSGLKGKPVGNARLENGALILDGNSMVETEPFGKDVKEKTLEVLVQLDNLEQRAGGAISIETRNGVIFDSIVFAEREPGQWMAGSNGFVRTDSFQAPMEKEAVKRPVHFAIVYRADGTITGYRDGTQYGRSIRKSGLQNYKAGDTEFIFGLRHKPFTASRLLRGKIFSAAFYDRALSAEEVSAIAGDPSKYVPEKQLVKWLTQEQQELRQKLKKEIVAREVKREAFLRKASQPVYTLTAGPGQTTNIFLRGDPDNVGEQVSAGAVEIVPGVEADFKLAPNAPEFERRQALSKWITSRDNPLFARVIVNRIWHYHFGTGIVDTPNDFGFNGGRPSHPDLLDWLAGFLQSKEYRLKPLHRLMVTSATYRQKSFAAPKQYSNGVRPSDVDANNRLFWRMNPRRLEAEAIRDAMLYVSGRLNDQVGGPSFEDVRTVSNNGTNYYFPIEEVKPEFCRRTVYRFNPRGGRSALLDTFDCPDPAATTPRRAVTTTPLQALSLLNNSFVLRMSNDFADRIKKLAGEDSTKQVELAWQHSVGRMPTDDEKKLAVQLIENHGLHSLARALFNINEFVAID